MSMDSNIKTISKCDKTSLAEILNYGCFCKTLNREQLDIALKADDLTIDLHEAHLQLFSNTSVFISPSQLTDIKDAIRAIERVAHLPGFQKLGLLSEDEMGSPHSANSGVFMGYDFHLSDTGPKLIEINTNAGGAFLNAALIHAQAKCCRESEMPFSLSASDLNTQFYEMFLKEWQYDRGNLPLARIAIVDENPQQQFLFPEFKMAKRLFEKHGIAAVIVDPRELSFDDNILRANGHRIDLVYNRLTDFSLSLGVNSALRAAYLAGAAVVTPNPYHHAIYANKRNLTWLCDANFLRKIDVDETDIHTLISAIPSTVLVTNTNSDQLWAERKELFFKPTTGFGSRAAYRGDKMTKRVWSEIIKGDYVAQRLILPSERAVSVDGEATSLKMDIRAYTYEGDIQLLAARLYQGQTTNFRTKEGGFAPVFVAT